ncbi:MAG: hypothetical protein KC492_28455, partial [Myxococcales bacterium]|nr:hypothetical protein [Myxococcales bacterium]
MFRVKRLVGASLLLCLYVSGCGREPATVQRRAPIRVAPDVPPAAPSVRADAPDPLNDLRPGYRERIQLRATLAVAGRLTFERGGDAVVEAERAIDVPFELVVIEQTPRELRVALEDSGAVVLAYVPRSDLAQRLTAETRLLLDPLPKPDRQVGIFLRPGAPIEILARTPRHFRARFRDSDLDCQGYLKKSALGDVYQPVLPTLGESELDANSQLLLEPDGAPLPCALSAGKRLVTELRRAGDHTLVEYASSHLKLVGWVRTAELHNASSEGFVKLASQGGFGSGVSDLRVVTLRSGALLRDAKGTVIGRSLRDAQLPLVSRQAQSSALQLNLQPWGKVS